MLGFQIFVFKLDFSWAKLIHDFFFRMQMVYNFRAILAGTWWSHLSCTLKKIPGFEGQQVYEY